MPEKVVGTPGVSYIYMWVVPAKVAGKWQVSIAGQDAPMEVAFDQFFQILEGNVRAGNNNVALRGRMNGEALSFVTQPKGSPGGQRHEFSGRVAGDSMQGTVRIGEGPGAKQANWTAKLAQRGELRRAADDAKAK